MQTKPDIAPPAHSTIPANMDATSSRRLAALGGHLVSASAVSEGGGAVVNEQMAGLGLNDTAATGSGVQQELQRLLEHDSFEERRRMKELMKSELFIP